MINIREQFKRDMIACYDADNGSKHKFSKQCIPRDLFRKILEEYLDEEYQQDEKNVLKEYLPKGQTYDRECAIACAEATHDVTIDDIIYNIGCTFWLILPIKIFEKAVLKFGIPLWNMAEPWANKRCYIKCPLGDCCNCHPDLIYSIGDKKYCLGQLYMNDKYHSKSKLDLPKFSDYELRCITIPFNRLLPPDREQYCDIEKVWNLVVEYSLKVHTGRFDQWGSDRSIPVPQYHRRTNTYLGGNVIPFL